MDTFGDKKPPADFVIRLVQDGLKPWKVPARALARMLQAFQRLIDQREEESDSSVNAEEPIDALPVEDEITSKSLRLVDVRSMSAGYGVAAPAHDFAIELIAQTGRGITLPETFAWNAPTLSAIQELGEIAKALKCSVEVSRPAKGKEIGEVLAKIDSSTYSRIVPSVFIKGETTVYAKLERIGGATDPHCGIRLPSQARKMVICHVSSIELVRQLGQHLYQHLLLTGTATWFRRSRNLKHFVVRSFEPPKTGSIRAALDEIHDASGGAWDDVKDVERKLAEIRGN